MPIYTNLKDYLTQKNVVKFFYTLLLLLQLGGNIEEQFATTMPFSYTKVTLQAMNKSKDFIRIE